jgi:hypothetical protein
MGPLMVVLLLVAHTLNESHAHSSPLVTTVVIFLGLGVEGIQICKRVVQIHQLGLLREG